MVKFYNIINKSPQKRIIGNIFLYPGKTAKISSEIFEKCKVGLLRWEAKNLIVIENLFPVTAQVKSEIIDLRKPKTAEIKPKSVKAEPIKSKPKVESKPTVEPEPTVEPDIFKGDAKEIERVLKTALEPKAITIEPVEIEEEISFPKEEEKPKSKKKKGGRPRKKKVI